MFHVKNIFIKNITQNILTHIKSIGRITEWKVRQP